MLEVAGQERHHLMPDAERDDHEPSEACPCRPIEGKLHHGKVPVWVHGLR